eukprot:TRINITY_DN49837_c0_g1_i5.p1 TRINITY_DN49837_c0_g1~~TRINITY_DN49837_c0_g1_i5.p1  ORF type:complete len:125 (+),score=21.09 TRINITY_DN49837_c0_g1_i5:255-629(+)
MVPIGGTDKVYCFNGNSGDDIVWIYNFDTDLWNLPQVSQFWNKTTGPTPRWGHTATTFDNLMFIVGGASRNMSENARTNAPEIGFAVNDAFLVFDMDTWEFLPWKIGRAVQQECRDRSRMPSSA